MARWLQSGWVHAGFTCWLLAVAILGGMAYATSQPGPTLTETFNEAQVNIQADQRAVWWNDGCTVLSWQIEGISGVWLDGEPTTGERTERYCLPPPAMYRGFYRDPARPTWRVQVASGEVRQFSVPIFVMQPFLTRWGLLLLGAGLLLMLVPATPATWREPRPLALDVDWRRLAALGGFGVALVSVLGYGYRVGVAGPVGYALMTGEYHLSLETNAAAIAYGGGCTQLAWQSSGIDALTFDGEPVAPNGNQALCAAPGASLVTLDIRAITSDGSEHARAFSVPVASAGLWFPALPGLLAGLFFISPLAYRAYPCRWRPLCEGGQLHIGLAACFVLVNVLVAYNITRHHPWVAYDGIDHFRYVLALAEGRFPQEEESNQFFAPPLAYIVPAAVHSGLVQAGLPPCPDYATNTTTCMITARAGQFQNLLLAGGVLSLMLMITNQLAPGRVAPRLWALALVGTMPAFYRGFVMIRGEPFTAFLVMLVVHRLLVMLGREHPTRADWLIYGAGTGLLIISRQWGVLAAIGMGVWALGVVVGRRDLRLVWGGLASYLLTLLVGGWFYLLNALRFGDVAAFNRGQQAGQPLEFFIGFGSGTLFSEPFRSTRLAQIIPIFYSELWGDFGGFWFVPVLSYDVWITPPPPGFVPYLGRVNIAALVPSAVLVAGLALGLAAVYNWLRAGGGLYAGRALLATVIGASLAGYGWFLATYPDVVGDTIKATYMLHLLPLVAILGALALGRLRRWRGWLHAGFVMLFLVATTHNLPMLVTRYTALP